MSHTYTVVEASTHPLPTAPSVLLQTPMSQHRLYPGLTPFKSPKRPKLRDRIEITPLTQDNRRENSIYNSKYWRALLKKGTFFHRSVAIKPARTHLLDETEIPLGKPTCPTIKKLRGNGHYVLKWQEGRPEEKRQVTVEGDIIPTFCGGVSVVFDYKEDTIRRFENFSNVE